MIIGIDVTTAPAGDLAPATLAAIAALGRSGTPARRLVLLGREEQRLSLRQATHGTATVLALDPADAGRRAVADYRRRKRDLLAAHGVELLHVAGGPLDVLSVEVPVVLEVDGLGHRSAPAQFTAAERGQRETWWTAAAFRADAVVVPDEAVGADLGRQLGVDPVKVFVRRPGTDPLPTLAAAYRHVIARTQPARKAA